MPVPQQFPLDYRSKGWDSAAYQVNSEDPSIKTEMDGGYMVSRPRHTRLPRKTFTIGWKKMLDTDKVILQNFWNVRRGGSNSFTWTDPVEDVGYTVRFKSQGLNFQYAGAGNTKLWDITIELEQV
jgi:hypothetical protein